MKVSSSRPWTLRLLCVVIAALSSAAALRSPAHAFGGFWSSQAPPVEPTAAEILFIDHPGPTITAIVRIEHSGRSQPFAWLVPVPSVPTVAISSSTVFERLDRATAPAYWLEVAIEGECMTQEGPGATPDASSNVDGGPSAPLEASPVRVNDAGAVGAYDYVDLEIDPALDDPVQAATDWLTTNGYEPTDLDGEALRPYLERGFHLLAFKLQSTASAGAIRPVAITYRSELPLIPIRPAAATARRELSWKVWVIGPSRAVPRSYASLVLDDAQLDWLSAETFATGTLPSGGAGPFGGAARRPSNYDAVVAASAGEAGGRGFVTEMAAPASQIRAAIWSPADEEAFTVLTSQRHEDGLDALLAARELYAGWDGWDEAVAAATTLPAGVTLEQLERSPEQHRGLVEIDETTLLERVEEHVVRPVTDTAALLFEGPYLTRFYGSISPDEMTVDPVFDYDFELPLVSNVHVARQVLECSPDRTRDEAPWRIQLPQGGVLAGEGRVWPVDPVGVAARPDGGTCSASNAGLRPTAASAPWWAALAVMLVLRRRRARPSCSSAPGARMGTRAAWPWLGLLTLACSREGGAPSQHDGGASIAAGALTREELRDPETCKGCHPIHFREWSSSMHAYAAQDPVFLAMNRRGQRETRGELGDFCVKCHAPMAVVDGLTRDGLELGQLPDLQRGVSCYFCHNVIGVEGDHNAMVRLANDTTMRGPLRDPFPSTAHRAEYSELFVDTEPESSALCGGCHDIVTPSGVHLERTFAEYKSGIFSKSATGEPPAFDSCVGCHMPGRTAHAAAVPSAPMRLVHEHLWPGVDVAVTDFPNRDALRSAVEDCELGRSVSFFTLEVTPPDLFTFQMETGAGHNQPSGAAQDRRMWLELLAYDQNGRLLEEVSSGNIADDEIEEKPVGDPEHDPHLLMFRDRLYDAQGKPAHMFWEAAKSAAYPNGYESSVLPVATTTYIEGKHAVLKQYRVRGPDGGLPARVTARLRMRPIGLDVLQDLVDSGDLDPAILAQMPTFSFGATIEWKPADGLQKVISAQVTTDCTTYRCMLDPGSADCR